MSTEDNVDQIEVEVDRDMCVGHGRCYSLAPTFYTSDDEGFGELVDGGSPATPAQRDAALLGVRNCPENAIKLSPA